MTDNYLHAALTKKVIQAFYKVYNKLGYGFLERVYQRALVIELKKLGLEVRVQHPVKIIYDGENIGDYFADLFIEGKVIVELKAAEAICPEHEAQLVNYLRATEVEVGLLLNFGPEAEVKRRVLTAAYKKHNKSLP